MRLWALILLLAGCAHVPQWETARTCRPWPGVSVAVEGDCGHIARAFDLAADMLEAEGVQTKAETMEAARKVSFVVLDAPRLYVNSRGRTVAGFTACDELPRVILDRTLQGLAHELIHARQCVSGAKLEEPKAGWRSFWAFGAWR